MKKRLFLAVMAFVGLMIVGCSCQVVENKSDDNSKSVTKTISNVPYFKKVVVNGAADVEFRQADKVSARIVGPRKMVDRIVVSVNPKDHSLVVSMKKGEWLSTDGSKSAKVIVSSPDLVALLVNGAGDFKMLGNLDTDTLSVMLKGAGDIDFENVVCDVANVALNGAGDIDIDKLVCSRAMVNLRGAGDMDIDNLTSAFADISLLGVGDIDVKFVKSGRVDCKLGGVGNVELSGDIEYLTKEVKGTGSLKTKGLVVNGRKAK